MKCVCGYYNLDDWEIELEDIVFQDDLRKNNGKEQFIIFEAVTNEIESYTFYKESHTKTFYICPKCGTVKVNI